MKLSLITALLCLTCSPVNAQVITQRVTPLNGTPDHGSWIIPAGVGGALLRDQMNQPLQSRRKKPQSSSGQLKINQVIVSRRDCVRLIKESGQGGTISVLDPINRQDPGSERVICTIGKSL